ncbi:MAG: tetratricopeptide repeat protein, partial [Elusimicrobium sp.]|nr:tetratricopeptide repeat protein [Elusimicrobium sp.]
MKIIFTILLALFSTLSYATEYASAGACVEKGKRLFADQKLNDAQAVFLECLALDGKNTDVIISLAGIYLAQNNIPAAKTFFETAVAQLPPASPYNAYCWSRLGDIYFKQGDLKNAKKAYESSLKFNYSNVNSIIGRGVAAEYEGDIDTAAKAYKTALSVEPYNPVARENYRRLEPRIFTDDETLAALKQRNAVSSAVSVLPPDGRELFLKIHRAEQSQGVEFLQDKYKNRVPQGMIIEINTGTPDLRFLLSLAGYKEVMRLMSMDAAKYFADAGVKSYQVYSLRDLN